MTHGTPDVTALRPVDRFTLRQFAEGEQEAPTSELLDQARATGTVVKGVILEAAVAWNDCFVLFVTDDIPFEDSLHIQLLDARLRPLDSASLSAMYSTGSFSALRLLPPNRVSFRFIGDTEWSIELLPQTKLRIPVFSAPPGVTRPFGFSQRFVVYGAPQPAQP